ncbi:lipin/Ned1/Smp2 family protein [Hahella ganghwensis]|uniref:lipin/Ned1/Smp2 family protein n=1 Tax=Hahella ganghwensis TaxID=286420 RepID=UPI0003681104|nr:haloacid dehalogenase [Hahella ganghwensis]
MNKALTIAACGLIAVTLSGTSVAEYCPDYGSVTNTPNLQKPHQKSFRHWGNRWLSSWHRPFHMVHDQIVKTGTATTMVGKFDYSSVFHKDLEDEDIHVYIYGTGMADWEYLGEYRTNSDGKIYVDVNKPEGDYRVRMIVEGDHSEATGYLTVVQPGRKAVLFDIDGTLTLNDFEAVGDYLGIDSAEMHGYASDVVWNYEEKGYQIIYLTGRQYWMAKTTRQWFNTQGLFQWHLRTDSNAENPVDPQTQEYKTNYIRYLLNDVELDIVRAYGNADTDIAAYADAGIPKSETYIIGPEAGNGGTQAIDGDYAYHYSTKVIGIPNSGCTWR